jgi:hypothetical protein
MLGCSRINPTAWLSLRHGVLGAVGKSDLRSHLSSPKCAVMNHPRKIPPNVSPQYARLEARLSDQEIGTRSIHRPLRARQGQCSVTAANTRSAMDDDGGGTSEHHPSDRPRRSSAAYQSTVLGWPGEIVTSGLFPRVGRLDPIEGRLTIHACKSGVSTSVRRPRFTARNWPDLIAP